MSAAETAARVLLASTSPFGVLQTRVLPYGQVESALLILLAGTGPILLLILGLAVGVPGLALLVMLLIPTPAIETLIALRYRDLWPAQEVLGRLNWEALDHWRENVGGRYPSNRRQIEEWLDRHPEGTVPAAARAGLLLVSGRVAEGRRTIASLPVETQHQRHQRAELELSADALEGLPLDTTAADGAIRSDLDLSPAITAAHLAYHAALKAVASGGDGVARLTEARPLVGALPPALVRRLWLNRLRYAVASAAGGAWLLLCLVVGLGTSGGVVWF